MYPLPMVRAPAWASILVATCALGHAACTEATRAPADAAGGSSPSGTGGAGGAAASPLTLTSAVLASPTELHLTFSEALRPLGAVDPSDFRLEPAIAVAHRVVLVPLRLPRDLCRVSQRPRPVHVRLRLRLLLDVRLAQEPHGVLRGRPRHGDRAGRRCDGARRGARRRALDARLRRALPPLRARRGRDRVDRGRPAERRRARVGDDDGQAPGGSRGLTRPPGAGAV